MSISGHTTDQGYTTCGCMAACVFQDKFVQPCTHDLKYSLCYGGHELIKKYFIYSVRKVGRWPNRCVEADKKHAKII